MLFRQTRPGLHAEPFTLYKFRTMKTVAPGGPVPADAREQALTDAVRLTTFGKLLRRASLDELPQLFNIIKGDMSFIGPRPLLMEYVPLYSAEQTRRHEVRPGLTGWAQVNGRNALEWDDRLALDVWYVDHLSLRLDARIFFMTVRAVLGSVFHGKGVSQPGQATMLPFAGSGEPPKGQE